jgi:pyruvate,water dikinase
MLFFLPDVQEDAITVDRVGGKAAGLHWLCSRGYHVPQTWVLTTEAFDEMVEAAGVQEHIDALDSVTSSQMDWAGTEMALQALADVRQALAEALQTTPLPPSIERVLQGLPQGKQWAVRSSATVEDAESHSFAGQFSTFLSVPGGKELVDAIRKVWISTFDKNVLHYRAERGIEMPRMAVLLQPMDPISQEDRAGTAFSQSTIPGLSGVLIQATYGAGVTVVGGAGGEVKCVDEAQIATYPQPSQHIMVTAEGGGLLEIPARPDGVLTDAEAQLLAEKLREIAPQYGRPVDIEFIWRDGEEPTFVQVRPITG